MEIIIMSFIISIILIVSGICKSISYYNKVKKYPFVTGYIKEFGERCDSDGFTTKYPIIHYEVNGQTYRRKGWGKNILNKPVTIYYNPDDPSKCFQEGSTGTSLIIYDTSYFSFYRIK